MKIVQVKPGKPSKFYVNDKRVSLNTAFGMYQKGAKLTVNGKKLNLNKFGVSPTRLDLLPDEIYREISDFVFCPKVNIPQPKINKYVLRPWGEQQFRNEKGQLHRVGGPATILTTVDIPSNKEHIQTEWFKNGKKHRVGGPALTITFGGKLELEGWIENGQEHRDDGPAEIYYDDNGEYIGETWYKKGQLHRDDGPAVISVMDSYDSDGNLQPNERWYKNGIEITPA